MLEKWEASFTGWKMSGGLGEFVLPGPFRIQIVKGGGNGKRPDPNLLHAFVHMGGGDNWQVLDKNLKKITDFDMMSQAVAKIFTARVTEWRKI